MAMIQKLAVDREYFELTELLGEGRKYVCV